VIEATEARKQHLPCRLQRAGATSPTRHESRYPVARSSRTAGL